MKQVVDKADRLESHIVGNVWDKVARRLWMANPRLAALAAVVSGRKKRVNGPLVLEEDVYSDRPWWA